MTTVEPPQSRDRKPIKAIQYHAHVIDKSGAYHLTYSLSNPEISKEVLDEIQLKTIASFDEGAIHSEAANEWFLSLQRQFEPQVLAEVATRKQNQLICSICEGKAVTLVHRIRFAGVFEAEDKLQPSVFDVVAPWCGVKTKGCKGALEKLLQRNLEDGKGKKGLQQSVGE